MPDRKQKEQTLFAQLARGLLKHSREETAIHLGDRTQYIGMSDIGKGVECMRAAVASKLGLGCTVTEDSITKWYAQNKHDSIYNALRRHLVLQRGHWLESGILPTLQANGSSVLSQLEVETLYNNVPIKAHIDFTLVWNDPQPTIRILELKSTERIPDTLYTSYETQLYGQLGFLVACWNQPAFSMCDEHGVVIFQKQTLSEAIQQIFGVSIPDSPSTVDIEGWVLCLAMSDAKAFGPYRFNDAMLSVCKKTAEAIWVGVNAVRLGQIELGKVSYCKGFHALCDYCDYIAACPKFEADPIDDPGLDTELSELLELKDCKRELLEKIAEKEGRIKRYVDRQGYTTGWIKTTRHRVMKASYSGAVRTDLQKLTELLKNELGENKGQQLIETAAVQGKSYDRLYLARLQEEE